MELVIRISDSSSVFMAVSLEREFQMLPSGFNSFLNNWMELLCIGQVMAHLGNFNAPTSDFHSILLRSDDFIALG